MNNLNLTNENQQVKQILKPLELKEQRLADKEAIISQLQYEKELIEEDIVNTIKNLHNSSINIFPYCKTDLLSNVWRGWGNENKSKQLKTDLDFVLNVIKLRLLNNDDDFKLKDIYDFCYSAAYEFIFDYKGQDILVYIPVFANINKENKLYIMCGYSIQYKQSEHIWDTITHGFDTNKISQDLKEWLKDE